MKSIRVIVLIFLTLTAFIGCQSAGGGNIPETKNYVSFTQTVRGLITGMTAVNGTLNLKRGTVETNVPVSNGSFSITNDLKLETGTYEVVLTTNEGVTVQVSDAVLGESSLYLPRSKRLIDNVIEKDEVLRDYVSSVGSRQLTPIEQLLLNWPDYVRTDILPAKTKYLSQLEQQLKDADSESAVTGLSKSITKVRDEIDRIEAGQYNLYDAYKSCSHPTSEVWLKRPTIVIYDQSVWSYVDYKWEKIPDFPGMVANPQYFDFVESYYYLNAFQYFDGLTNTRFDIIKESDGAEMPDPNIALSASDEQRYIFFIVHDDVSFKTMFGNTGGKSEHVDYEVLKSWVAMPYNFSFDAAWWNTLRLWLFYTLRIANSHFFFDAPVQDSYGNPSAIMKLVGKVKNHRDPGHIIDFENGEYTDKYGYYQD